jgi:type IV pilus assembly protein PilB
MAKKDLGDFLIERRIIGKDQLAEAKALAKNNGGKVHDVLIKQGYATSEQVMQAMADLHGFEFFDLRDVPIPPHVVELVPESVARENAVIPLAEEDGALKVLTSDPFDYETQEKLQFILNRKVDRASSKPSTATTAKWETSRPTRCCRNSPIRQSTSPRRKRARTAAPARK